jgi:acyl-ACP thioesterase
MTSATPDSLKRTFRLHSWEVDHKGRAKPDVLFSFMLDSAWAHANNSEFSYDALKEEGQLWVLSRFLAVVHELPRWDDEITVETWSKGTDKLFGLRDFAVVSGAGSKLVSATSAWLVIDRKTSRIQRIDLENSNFPVQLERHEIDTRLGKIGECETSRTDFDYVVKYGDIDVNNHVNSSRYMRWILDSFPRAVLEDKRLGSFEINFLAEAQYGDRVYVSTADTGDYYQSEIIRERDGVGLCRTRLVWE